MNGDDEGLKRLEGRLDEHARVLNEHTRTLHSHTLTLQEHTRLLHEHTGLLHEHTGLLHEIREGIAPIAEMRDFMNRVAHDHEHRIKALEDRVLPSPP
jgi:hypothetical protein